MADGVIKAEDRPRPKGNSGLGLALLVVWVALGAALARMANPPGLITFLFVIAGWTLALALHEFAHAFTAYLGGDTTVADKGYLTFDPRRYTDVGSSLVIPLIALALGGIGFPGGAVYLREDLMRGPAWRAAASLAGPLGTLVALLLLAWGFQAVDQPSAIAAALAFLAFLQASALVLNLLPLPGLDGYGVIRPFLPQSVQAALRPVEGLVFVGLIVLIFVIPGAGLVIFGLAAALTQQFGIPAEAISAGWRAFQFWRGG